MRKYNGLPRLAALALTALAAGCATQASRTANYPVETPPESEPVITMGKVDKGPAPRLRETAPLRYVVKKGDTLWDISSHFLRDAWQWPEIWYRNDGIKNPHLIYPGDVLTLVYVDGRPRLVAENGVSFGGTPGQARMSPMIRAEDRGAAVPAIPMEAIADYLQKSRVVEPETLKKAPYIVAFMDPQVTAGAGSVAYVKNMVAGPNAAYSIVRLGKKFRDPKTGEDLGWEAVPVGEVEVVNFDKLTTVNIVKSVREVRPGDQLIEHEKEVYDAFFYPKISNQPIVGQIISVLDGTGQIGQYSIVTLNRGAREGVERGDVFNILQTGRVARDPYNTEKRIILPSVQAGQMMVFKVNEKASFALVLSSTRAIVPFDGFITPESLR